jgi:menaquinone-dependent protoporphyrinogen IX oxidase
MSARNVLACAASKYGATSEIAQAVADILAEKGLEVCVVPPEQVGAIEEFDAVVAAGIGDTLLS